MIVAAARTWTSTHIKDLKNVASERDFREVINFYIDLSERKIYLI